jgi:hypothetical protein
MTAATLRLTGDLHDARDELSQSVVAIMAQLMLVAITRWAIKTFRKVKTNAFSDVWRVYCNNPACVFFIK